MANGNWQMVLEFQIWHLPSRRGPWHPRGAKLRRPSSIHMHPKMRNRRLSHPVGALHLDDKISRLREGMCGDCESILGVFVDVAIRFGCGRRAVPERPMLFPIRCAESAYLEGDRAVWRNGHRR